MFEDFIKVMQAQRKYFLNWKEEYSYDDGEETYCAGFHYIKDNYYICFDIDWRGHTALLSVYTDISGYKAKRDIYLNAKKIVDISYGKCDIPKEFDNNNIRKRVKKAYKTKEKQDKETGLYSSNQNKNLVSVYIEFLIENGILADFGKMG